jgi:hypothetical protein
MGELLLSSENDIDLGSINFNSSSLTSTVAVASGFSSSILKLAVTSLNMAEFIAGLSSIDDRDYFGALPEIIQNQAVLASRDTGANPEKVVYVYRRKEGFNSAYAFMQRLVRVESSRDQISRLSRAEILLQQDEFADSTPTGLVNICDIANNVQVGGSTLNTEVLIKINSETKGGLLLAYGVGGDIGREAAKASLKSRFENNRIVSVSQEVSPSIGCSVDSFGEIAKRVRTTLSNSHFSRQVCDESTINSRGATSSITDPIFSDLFVRYIKSDGAFASDKYYEDWRRKFEALNMQTPNQTSDVQKAIIALKREFDLRNNIVNFIQDQMTACIR